MSVALSVMSARNSDSIAVIQRFVRGSRDALVGLGAMTVVVEYQQVADRLGHVAADRVIPIGI